MPSRAAKRPFIVGANMPWGRFCGHDFGARPYGWGDGRQDFRELERELRALRALGVTVVRWFVLASGVSYPNRPLDSVRQANTRGLFPQAIDDFAHRVAVPFGARAAALWRRAISPTLVQPAEAERDFEWLWNEGPTPLNDAFVADFLALCRACRAAGVRLIPSLLSFEWFQAIDPKIKGVNGGARGRLILGPHGNARVQAHVHAFLDATLDRLLDATTRAFGPAHSADHPIFAWESINEPDWVTEGGPRLLAAPAQPVRALEMNTLLQAFRERVTAAGYAHTIGFKQLRPAWLDSTLHRTLVNDGDRYWHQAHHYPTAGVGRLFEQTLATNRTLPAKPSEFSQCLIGEFPSARGQRSVRSLDNWTWGDDELARSEHDPLSYLRARWELMRERGYQGAILWSAKPGRLDTRSHWSAETQRQTAAFAARVSATDDATS